MEELIQNLKETSKKFLAEAEKFETGNKSAGTRARKASLQLEKLMKQFRKDSIAR